MTSYHTYHPEGPQERPTCLGFLLCQIHINGNTKPKSMRTFWQRQELPLVLQTSVWITLRTGKMPRKHMLPFYLTALNPLHLRAKAWMKHDRHVLKFDAYTQAVCSVASCIRILEVKGEKSVATQTHNVETHKWTYCWSHLEIVIRLQLWNQVSALLLSEVALRIGCLKVQRRLSGYVAAWFTST